MTEVKKLFATMVAGELSAGSVAKQAWVEQRPFTQNESATLEPLPCRSPAAVSPAAAAQLKSWAASFRATTSRLDTLMDSIARAKMPADKAKQELAKLSTFWSGSKPYISGGSPGLSIPMIEAKALYAEELKLMIETGEIVNRVFQSNALSPADMERLKQTAAMSKIFGRVADRLLTI